jgi:hypothetical protein
MTKKMGSFGLIVILSLLITQAAHAEGQQADVLSISNGKVEIEEITPASQVKANKDGAPSSAGDLSSVLNPITQIINIGKEIWPIIQANKPVANVQAADAASAVPSSNWQQLAGWSAPQSRTFHFPYKNTFGMTLVDLTFDVIYTYGGNLNGAGHYISGVTIVPTNLSVQMGMTFNADVKVINVTNAGTLADPLAAMQIQLHWLVESISSHKEGTDNFYIRGDGEFSRI